MRVLLRIYPEVAFCFSVFLNSSGSFAANTPQLKVFQKEDSYLIVESLTDELLHFELAPGTAPVKKVIHVSPMVHQTKFDGPSFYQETDTTVETASLHVSVEPLTFCTSVYDKIRKLHLSRICPTRVHDAWKTLTLDSPDFTSVHGLGSYFDDPQTTDGDWIGRVWDPLSDGFGARLRGFGNGANNFSMYPIMYALGADQNNYGFFLDNTYKQMWDFRTRPWTIGMWGDQVRWYFIAGDSLPTLRRRYMDLTGHPPVPPKRNFGLWVSEFGFSSWDEVTATLAGLRRAKFPVDGFGMDLQWFGGTFGDPHNSRMGSLTWDPRSFPEASSMIQKLDRDQGVGLMLIEEPYVSSLLPEHRELELRGHLVRDCENCAPAFLNSNPWWGYGGMVDFTNPDASRFWHNFRRQPLIDQGVAGHWLDLGEPEQFNSHAWYSNNNGMSGAGKHGHADVHNIYGFRWVEGIKSAYDADKSGRRPQILSRTGTSGIQRFGTAIWSGDTGTNWGNLRTQQRVQMQMSMSGVDYYGSDVGGFQKPGDDIEGTSESLYTQWFANAAVFDVPLRPHAWNLDKRRSTSPALRGDVASNLENTRLRYHLAPYLYSLAHQAHQHGDPVFPPAFFYFQDEDILRKKGDLKMIGPNLMAATVTQHGQLVRQVYLPKGEWFNLQTQSWSSGSRHFFPTRKGAALQLPLFARDGAIIPVMAVDQETMNMSGRRSDGKPDHTLRLKIFSAGRDGNFDVVNDDGTTTGYLRGELAHTYITMRNEEDSKITLSISAQQGTYPGSPTERALHLEFWLKGRSAESVLLNNATLPRCETVGRRKNSCWTALPGGSVTISSEALPVDSAKVIAIATKATPWSHSAFFICENAVTQVGTSVYIVGNTPSLGNWNPDLGQRMDASAYPTWTRLVTGLKPNQKIEWKCVKRREGGAVRNEWQQGANNSLEVADFEYAGPTWGRF